MKQCLKYIVGARKMALWLRALTAPQEDFRLVLSTHVAPAPEAPRPSSALCWHVYTRVQLTTQDTYKHITKNENKS